MSFVNSKNNNSRYTMTVYSSINLQFLLVRDFCNNSFILYKEKINVDNYKIKKIITSLINNYIGVIGGTSLYTYSTKFINFDEMVSKSLGTYTEYDQYSLFINITNVDFSNLTMTTIACDNETNINFEIVSNLDSNLLEIDQDLSFDEVCKQLLKSVLFRIRSILSEIIGTNFKKIEDYLSYLDLNYYMQRHKNLNFIFKNFKITLSELTKFNKLDIDFSRININCEKFESMLLDSPASLSLKYENFKFLSNSKIRLSEDHDKSIKIHVPLLNSHFDFGDMSITDSKYSSTAFYRKKNDLILQNVIRLNYYLLNKYNNFNKFKDEYEKLVLK